MRIGAVMKPTGTIVIAGCYSGANINVMGTIAKASGRDVLSPNPLVKPGLIFKGEVISYFDKKYSDEYKYLKTDKANLFSPAANQNGFISKETPMFGISLFGTIFYR